jgi:FtsP/CotA-like multicopper oxidase with cupredoxin domain
LINVTNHLPNATSLHWHGIFQNGTNWYDGTSGVTQCPIPPGQSLLYNFTIENQFGTYWYHAHSETQYIDGLVGPLIVHAPEEAESRKLYEFDQVVLLSDWYHDTSATLLPGYLASGNENTEPVPDNGLIQGENYFNCSSYTEDSGYQCDDTSGRAVFGLELNKRYRLRFINTGAFTSFHVSIDNHTLEIIEADGTLVEPLGVDRFEIAVAQRYSVILHANQSTTTNYWLRGQMNTNCYAEENPVLNPDVLALITYTNSTPAPKSSAAWSELTDIECRDLNSTLLSPIEAEKAPPADALYELFFSFFIGDYALSRADVNGTTWIPSLDRPSLSQAISGLRSGNPSWKAPGVITASFSPNQYVLSMPSEQRVIDILILNFDDGSHPFHLHGHPFWIMAEANYLYFPWDSDLYSKLNSSTSNVYNRNPVRRDTVTIGAYSWALVRFRNNNPGMWALHCHNVWHLQAGMMAQLLTRSEDVEKWVVPESVQKLCT